MDAKNKGWISLYRGINNHWIWQDPEKFKAWVDILLTVNHSDGKVLIGEQLFVCHRGESLMSIKSWAKRFRWNESATRRFLHLLEKDEMITLKNEVKTTRLTVCKYDEYQDSRSANEVEVKSERSANEVEVKTNNNVNNDNNENKVIKKSLEERKKDFALALQPFVEKYGRDMINKFYKHWTAHNPNDRKMAFELSKTGKFYIANRLATWKQNESKFNSPKQQTQTTSKIETVLNAFEDVSKLYQ